jgi:hypothetical protein
MAVDARDVIKGDVGARELLGGEAGGQHVAAQAAMLGRRVDAEQAESGHRGERGVRDAAARLDLGVERLQLPLDEAPDLVAPGDELVRQPAAHRRR